MCNCFEPLDLRLTEPIHSWGPAPLTYFHTNQITEGEIVLQHRDCHIGILITGFSALIDLEFGEWLRFNMLVF